MKTTAYKNGDAVWYFDRDIKQWVKATITDTGDTKNEFPVYGVVLTQNLDERWGYDDQIKPRSF